VEGRYTLIIGADIGEINFIVHSFENGQVQPENGGSVQNSASIDCQGQRVPPLTGAL